MFSAYLYLYIALGLLLAAYFPAMIAAGKGRRFSYWYVYGFFLFPIAVIHALFVKKPEHRINIFIHDKKNFSRNEKKTYKVLSKGNKEIVISPRYIYMVFFSKLIFGAFVAFSVFAIFRTMVLGTESLKRACVIFAVMFSVMLSIVELCRLSKFPALADEITKRALIIIWSSVISSLPLYLIKTFVADPLLPKKFSDFLMFIFTIISFGIFVAILLKRQRLYNAFFEKISGYCFFSMFAYAMFAAVSLIGMSVADLREYVYALAMPSQLFNLKYLSGIDAIGKLPYIYSTALVHLFVEVILLISGLLCRNFKLKERQFRIEYRSKAFRMSGKNVLHRHITK